MFNVDTAFNIDTDAYKTSQQNRLYNVCPCLMPADYYGTLKNVFFLFLFHTAENGSPEIMKQ